MFLFSLALIKTIGAHDRYLNLALIFLINLLFVSESFSTNSHLLTTIIVGMLALNARPPIISSCSLNSSFPSNNKIINLLLFIASFVLINAYFSIASIILPFLLIPAVSTISSSVRDRRN